VFIPKKVDKWGRKFGFVKFKEVKEVELLSQKLEDVWWNNHKLQVNRAMFGKGEKKEGDKPSQFQGENSLVNKALHVSEELSFKSLLLGRKVKCGAEVDKDGMVVNGDGGRKKTRVLSMSDLVPIDIPVQETTLKALSLSIMGFFKETMDFQAFQDRLLWEGQYEVIVTYMGGNMVLIQCSCEGDISEVVKFNKHWWDNCFLKIIPWKPSILSESRDIRIQVYGIPLHTWEECSFKMMVGRFGVFLDFDAATVAKQRLVVATVKLRTVRKGMIDIVLQLKVQEAMYDVWVVEERCCCGEERSGVDEEGHRTGEEIQINPVDQGWKGEERDQFSEDGSESDRSEEGKKDSTKIVGSKEGQGKGTLTSKVKTFWR
jgi:hypothetical protein